MRLGLVTLTTWLGLGKVVWVKISSLLSLGNDRGHAWFLV